MQWNPATLFSFLWMVAMLVVAPRPAQCVTHSSTHVAGLIQRLGANDYNLRVQAREELQQLGATAFDALLLAQYDADTEIRLAARKLVSEFQVKWVQPQDPSVVALALRDYALLSPAKRVERGEWLARLEDGLGTTAVLRIARYETDEPVAKQVVLRYLEAFDVDDPAHRAALRQAADRVLGGSRRPTALWMKTWLTQLEAESSDTTLAAWKQAAAKEFADVATARTSPAIAVRLAEWCATQALRQEDAVTAEALLPEMVLAAAGSGDLTLRVGRWLIDEGQLAWWDLFLKLTSAEDRDTNRFAYCLAEALKRQGDTEKAEQAAAKAFAWLDDAERFPDPISATRLRLITAIQLEHRGCTEWSLREYGHLIDQAIVDWRMARDREDAIRMMAELLHDQGRHADAADTLEKLFADAREVTFPEGDLDAETAGLVSRMHYFRAKQSQLDGDRERYVALLRKAIEADPTDADVLIAMFHLPRAGTEWKQETREKIREAEKQMRTGLEQLRRHGVLDNKVPISIQLNQLAWLIGNTEGDQQQAIRHGRRSLELEPGSGGTLDTLARAYFSAGDLSQARNYQRRAVKLLPHSLQIQRQFDEFEAATQSTEVRHGD